MNKFEIDRYDYSVCPFNQTHRFSPEQYQYHILRCKDRHFTHVINTIQQCPHNNSHYFANPYALSYHTPRCPDYPGRLRYTLAAFGSAPKEIEYMNCPYNPLHGIRVGEASSFKKHIDDCPNKDKIVGHNPLPQPSLDKSVTGQLNYKHGLIASEDISIVTPSAVITQSRSNKIMIHFTDKNFTVIKVDVNSGIEENDIWAGQITFANTREWPGLKLIEDSRSHSHYHVGNLFPDKSVSLSEMRFKGLVNLLTVSSSNNTSIAVSAQAASDKNRLIFIVHRSEETGFGACLAANVELGIFYLPHSMLYNNESILKTQQMKIQEKEIEIKELQQRLQITENEKQKMIEDWNSLKIEYEHIKSKERDTQSIYESRLAEFERDKETLRTEVFYTLEKIKRESELEKIELKNHLDKVTNEKNSLQFNLFSETQNMKKAEKNNQDRLNKMINELKEDYEKEHLKLIEAQNLNNTLREYNSGLEQKLVEQRSRVIGNDVGMLIKEAVDDEREKIYSEIQERETCAICYNEKKNVFFAPCGHILYCQGCIKSIGIVLDKKIAKTNPHSKCSVCGADVKKAHRAHAY